MSPAKIAVRVQPRAKSNEIAAIREGVVQIRIAAPAIEGRANEALRKLVAKTLGVAPSNVTVIRGHHSKDKVLEVDGITQQQLDRAIAEQV